MKDHSEFLDHVRNYVDKNPDVAAYVSDAVASGLSTALARSNERAADMEVVVAVLMARKNKTSNGVIFNKLSKWHNKSALNWTSTLKELEEKVNPS